MIGKRFGARRYDNEQHDAHVVAYEREIIRTSDEYSPAIKRAMEHFWAEMDRLDGFHDAMRQYL